MDGIGGFLIGGLVMTLVVLLFMWVFGKIPYLNQVKALAIGS